MNKNKKAALFIFSLFIFTCSFTSYCHAMPSKQKCPVGVHLINKSGNVVCGVNLSADAKLKCDVDFVWRSRQKRYVWPHSRKAFGGILM